MSNIKLLRDPGFVYDLYFLFDLKFNVSSHAEELDNGRSKESNVKYYTDMISQFGDIPENLFVFFHRIDNGRIFMTRHYFVDYQDHFSSDFNFQFILGELRDQKKIIYNMIRFYLHDLSNDEINDCYRSSEKLFWCIRNSKYSAEEKSRIYEFFLDPAYHIDMLRCELIEKEALLSNYYKDNYNKIIDVHNKTTFDILKKNLEEIRDLSFLEKDSYDLYATYCLISEYLSCSFATNEQFVFLLGCNYLLNLCWGMNNTNDIKIEEFGNGIGDISRSKILWFILEKGEATCKDLEKAFDFSGSTSYHHITLMTRVGVLKTRNEGKTVYYSINRKYFDAAIGVLNKFASNKSQF